MTLVKLEPNRTSSLVPGDLDWILIPAGPFWSRLKSVGSTVDEVSLLLDDMDACFLELMDQGVAEEHEPFGPEDRLSVEVFQIARTPVTNAQYSLFSNATGHACPAHWTRRKYPSDTALHPVTNVTWNDANRYCAWLSGITNRNIRLPSEAEWEKAARGDKDDRPYPWGYRADPNRCHAGNTIPRTIPVAALPAGASPYGCLNMVGNVWELTSTALASQCDDMLEPFLDPCFPAVTRTTKPHLIPDKYRAIRGGSFATLRARAEIDARQWVLPDHSHLDVGFRVVSAPWHR